MIGRADRRGTVSVAASSMRARAATSEIRVRVLGLTGRWSLGEGASGVSKTTRSRFPVQEDRRRKRSGQLLQASGATVTTTLAAEGSSVTTSRSAPAAEATFPPVTLGQ